VGIRVRRHVSGKCYIRNMSVKWGLWFGLCTTKVAGQADTKDTKQEWLVGVMFFYGLYKMWVKFVNYK
jgi:hypothetical protein